VSLSIASFSDVHLLHPQTKTEFIIDNLNRHLSNPEFLAKVNLVFLAGDLFDSGQEYSDANAHAATAWVHRLMMLCARYGIVLRVLEGTPSHDRKQSKIFDTLKEVGNYPGLDYKYVDKLSIEYIAALGIRVLYVPDEVNHDTAITEGQVRALMKSEGIDQVDYACMHGLFDFQVPEQLNPHIKFTTEFFLGIVKRLIFIGHDHTYQTRGRICVHGSFDRLKHGEEGPKGFVHAVVEDDGHYVFNFIENKTAKIYKTFKITGSDAEKTLDMLSKQTKKMPIESHVRLVLERTHPLTQSLKALKAIAPHVVWKIDLAKEKLKKLTAGKENGSISPPLIINPNTIAGLVRGKLKQQLVPDELLELAMDKLQEVI
jgi:DNA repair exonuclease SbcCD nuclease subunit